MTLEAPVDPPLSRLAQVAEDAARAGGSVAMEGYRGTLEVRSKGGKDIVTQYDTAAERVALDIILGAFPTHSILAEESGATGEMTGADVRWLWAVDPIDGTHNYAAQIPFWCCSVAVADARLGRVVAGAVFDPVHGEMFTASLGRGAFLDGKPIHVSTIDDPDRALVVSDIGHSPEYGRRLLSLIPWVQPRVWRWRLLGSAVLAMVYVAAGRADAYYHLSLNPWDLAAASLLISEAGGTITDWEGNPLSLETSGTVAANPALHPRMLALLQDGERC